MIEVEGLDLVLPASLTAGLSDAAITTLVTTIADAARAEWIRLAGEALHTTRGDYLAGIQLVEVVAGAASVSLLGKFPNLLEEGMPSYDMHDTLLGPNVPVAGPGERGKRQSIDPKTGDVSYYRAIPFRHKTGAKGAGFGNPYRGHDAVKDAARLGREIYGAAKKLAPSTSSPYGGSRYGGRLPAGMAPKLRPHHAVDIYAGMVRQVKTYERATQGQYTTFRTIATDSPGWIRPATPGLHLAQQVVQYVQQIAPKALSAYVAQL